MNLTLKIQCPLCQFFGDFVLDYNPSMAWRPHVLNCDCERGGCDKNFAVLIKLTPEIRTFKFVEAKLEASPSIDPSR